MSIVEFGLTPGTSFRGAVPQLHLEQPLAKSEAGANHCEAPEFAPSLSDSWSETTAHEELDEKRLSALTKRYKTLLRLSRSVTSARSQDLEVNIANELRNVVDFDLISIFLKPEISSQLAQVPERSSSEAQTRHSSKEAYREESIVVCSSREDGELQTDEIKSHCSIPLIGRNSELGFLFIGRFTEASFDEDDVEFLTQVASHVAMVIDSSLAYRHIAHLTERLTPENISFDDQTSFESDFEEIVGRSSALRSLLAGVKTVAPTDSTVLIYGETGTGKELIARALHKLSDRRSGPFIKLNCAAIPTGLLESELFGHEKGAFTSAIAQRIGRFELANAGTIFLDEIGDIPLELQPKLLRVLQEREFERLGSSRTIKTNARLIAATHRDLGAMVQENKFRSDLFYRLNVFPVQLPPLRERREDIPLLVRHFVEHFSRRMKKTIESIPRQGIDALTSYSWPGNIRELENVIEHAVIVSSGPELRVPVEQLTRHVVAADGWKPQTLEEVERAHILATLKKTRWAISGSNGAAIRLGLNRSTLQFRMNKLGIVRPGK
jgi:formate hydrogenlyase transcriptional activator